MASGFDFSGIKGFDWDKGNLEHIKKHNVGAKECEETFFNKPLIINRDETHSQTEERLRVYGQTNKGRLLFMIFTIRKVKENKSLKKNRVISARDQSKKERKEFQEIGGENL